jgi:HSP20 family molecular chaperone IbpA
MSDESKDMVVQDQEMVPTEETERIRERACFVPRADIYETDENVFVIVDMPGVSGDAIDITLEKNILTINGNTSLDAPEGYSLAFAEYEVGDFERSFRLTDQIDRDGIGADYKDGVLRLVLPKAEEAKARKINIKKG